MSTRWLGMRASEPMRTARILRAIPPQRADMHPGLRKISGEPSVLTKKPAMQPVAIVIDPSSESFDDAYLHRARPGRGA